MQDVLARGLSQAAERASIVGARSRKDGAGQGGRRGESPGKKRGEGGEKGGQPTPPDADRGVAEAMRTPRGAGMVSGGRGPSPRGIATAIKATPGILRARGGRARVREAAQSTRQHFGRVEGGIEVPGGAERRPLFATRGPPLAARGAAAQPQDRSTTIPRTKGGRIDGRPMRGRRGNESPFFTGNVKAKDNPINRG